jgi:hypothetical protein
VSAEAEQRARVAAAPAGGRTGATIGSRASYRFASSSFTFSITWNASAT